MREQSINRAADPTICRAGSIYGYGSREALSLSQITPRKLSKKKLIGLVYVAITMALMPDVVLNLHDFITKQPNYVVWVLINVNLDSSYGTLALQSCFQQPSHLIPPAPSILIPACPAPRSSSGGGGGGG